MEESEKDLYCCDTDSFNFQCRCCHCKTFTLDLATVKKLCSSQPLLCYYPLLSSLSFSPFYNSLSRVSKQAKQLTREKANFFLFLNFKQRNSPFPLILWCQPNNWCFWTVVLEKTLESQRDPTSPSERKSVLNIHWKDWSWIWNFNTLDTWCKELTYLKRPQCWERSKVGGEGEDRGWDGWMASLTQWTWVWVDSGSWWWPGRPDVLLSMG